MTLRVRGSIPYGRLHMPGLFIRYISGDATLDRFLPRRPKTARELLGAARDRIGWIGCDEFRPELAGALRAYAERFAAPVVVGEAADKLGQPGTVAIVTGQQPALFGGPLYVWHKVATALRLARQIRAEPGAPEVVTVFWNWSDDHDWGEANHSYLLNHALDIQRIRLRLPTTGRPLFDIPVGDAVADAIEEARDLLPANGAAEMELARLQPQVPEETLGTLLSRLLFEHFGDEGLLICEPWSLPSRLRDPLREFHAHAEELRRAMKSASVELHDRGFDVPVDPEGPFLFHMAPGSKRQSVPDGESCPPDHQPSPGVMMRSVWQDRILPTLAYVAGPGEVSYLALARRFYTTFGVPRPPIVPRASVTHVEPRLTEHLERWALELQDLEPGPKAVEALMAAREGGEDEPDAGEERPEDVLLALADELRDRLRELEPRVADVDRSLCHSLARIGSRTGSDLNKFVAKLRNQRRNQAGRFRQHARRLCGELKPRGRLQERVLPALPFLVREGGLHAGPDRGRRPVRERAPPGRTGAALSHRVLCLAAHPDDLEVYLGAGLLLFRRARAQVRAVVASAGESATRQPVRGSRIDEQQRVFAQLGIEGRWLGLPDGQLAQSRELQPRINEEIEGFDPELLFAPHESDGHSDHAALARAVVGHRSWAWLDGFPRVAPTHFVYLGPDFAPKAELIGMHASQIPEPGESRAHLPRGLDILERARQRDAAFGHRIGIGYAEPLVAPPGTKAAELIRELGDFFGGDA